MKRLALVISLGAIVGGVVWLLGRREEAREVPFARARRQTLASVVRTNGKVEPVHRTPVAAERAGVVAQVHTERGRRVRRGELLVELATEGAEKELAAAEARLVEAQATLEMLEGGGRAADRAAVEAALAAAEEELATARRELESLARLLDKQAATREEVLRAGDRVRKAELEVEAQKRRREALVVSADRAAAEARRRQALADRERAARRLAQSRIRAPSDGVIYDLPVRPGSYVQPGDPVAEIGRLETLRVLIYVDEPELGGVAVGMPVIITWDARPGKQWQGVVEKGATQIVKLGTRQIGEVVGEIDNADLELVPGANVNIEIRSRVVENTLTVPKEALRRRGETSGVLVLEGNRVAWRSVEPGIASITHVEVVRGLAEGDAVALATDQKLDPGDLVRPRFPEE